MLNKTFLSRKSRQKKSLRTIDNNKRTDSDNSAFFSSSNATPVMFSLPVAALPAGSQQWAKSIVAALFAVPIAFKGPTSSSSFSISFSVMRALFVSFMSSRSDDLVSVVVSLLIPTPPRTLRVWRAAGAVAIVPWLVLCCDSLLPPVPTKEVRSSCVYKCGMRIKWSRYINNENKESVSDALGKWITWLVYEEISCVHGRTTVFRTWIKKQFKKRSIVGYRSIS